MGRLAFCLKRPTRPTGYNIPGLFEPNVTAYVDMASVRKDEYPKTSGWESRPKNYVVAWIKTQNLSGQIHSVLEVVFDCKGRFGIVQTISNDFPDSKHHSYDATTSFEAYGAQTKSIMPDSSLRAPHGPNTVSRNLIPTHTRNLLTPLSGEK
jgi:hypothetical protein